MTTREAILAMERMRAALDPDGVRTIEGARRLYLRGEIDVDEFERRVGLFLGDDPIAVLQPGESILRRENP